MSLLILLTAREEGFNSSVILWDSSEPVFHILFDYLIEHYSAVLEIIYKFDHYLEMMLLYTGPSSCLSLWRDTANKEYGVSGVTHMGALCGYFQTLCPGRFVDYFTAQREYNERLSRSIELSPMAVVCFPLFPKPHDIKEQEFIQKYWMGV